jgi:DNA-binding FadR family transcriptional regulator
VARTKLSGAIVTDFLGRIGSGELAPGSLLPPEAALCEEYGVGRSVIREALQALDAKGFIVIRQGSVAAVAPSYHWHVLDPEFLDVNSGEEFFERLQEAREVLEPTLAALAATRATPELIEEMAELNRRLADLRHSPREHAEVDIAFHDAIARATDNAILVSLHGSVTGLAQRSRSANAAVPGAVDRAAVWHGHILDAIRSHDAVGASSAMHLHLRQVRSELSKIDRAALSDPKDPSSRKKQGGLPRAEGGNGEEEAAV